MTGKEDRARAKRSRVLLFVVLAVAIGVVALSLYAMSDVRQQDPGKGYISQTQTGQTSSGSE